MSGPPRQPSFASPPPGKGKYWSPGTKHGGDMPVTPGATYPPPRPDSASRPPAPPATSLAFGGGGGLSSIRPSASAAPYVPASIAGSWGPSSTASSSTATITTPAATSTLSAANAKPFVPKSFGGGVTSPSPAHDPSPIRFMKPAGPTGMSGNTPHRANSRDAALRSVAAAAPPPSPSPAAVAAAAVGMPQHHHHQQHHHHPPSDSSSGAGAGSGDPSSAQVFRGGCLYVVPEGAAGEFTGGDMSQLMAPTTAHPGPRRRVFRSKFLPDSLYEHFQHQNRLMLAQVDPADPRYKELPSQFTCMVPLDNDKKPRGTTGSTGYVTSLYKVISSKDGLAYALRRVDNVRSSNHIAAHVVDAWSRVRHPNLIPLRESFVYQSALFFIHDYYPGSATVRELYLDNTGPLLLESVLWSYAVQLATAIEPVHRAGMSLRGLHASRVLVTSHNRVRISSCGVLDVLEVDSQTPMPELQQADVMGLGQLLLQLAVRNTAAVSDPAKSLKIVNTHYSVDFGRFLYSLISEPKSIVDVVASLAPHITGEVTAMYSHADALEGMLGQECENGRLFRLLLKMSMVNDRAGPDAHRSWAETGEKYLMKLFRDYVFHQVDEEGNPAVDLAHVIDSLNKLDVGDPTEVLLSSPDERTLIAASFSDVRVAMDKAYSDLRARGPSTLVPRTTAPPPPAGGGGFGAGGGFGRGRGTPAVHSRGGRRGGMGRGGHMGGGGGGAGGGIFVPGMGMPHPGMGGVGGGGHHPPPPGPGGLFVPGGMGGGGGGGGGGVGPY